MSCWAVARFCMLVKTSASLSIGSCSVSGVTLSCAGIVYIKQRVVIIVRLSLDGILSVRKSGTTTGDLL